MGRLAFVCGIIGATAVGLLVTVIATTGLDGLAPIGGMQPVCTASQEPCWLVVGGGVGVVVIGLAGAGIVSLTLYGVGLFIGTGQLAGGGIALGQLGVGITGFAGQVGGAFVAFGQGVGGVIADGQGSIGIKGKPFLERFNRELAQVLRWRGPLP